MIAIICAMSEEKEAILKRMKDVQEKKFKKFLYHGTILDSKYYVGKLKEKEVALFHSGVGKVYAAIVAAQAIEKCKPELVINLGCAGSLSSEVHVNDIVVANRVADWDKDVPGWERSLQSDKMSFACDGRTLKLANKHRNVKIGPIVSGESFVYKKSQVKEIKKYFPEALCTEMEGSSIGNTCYAYGVNFTIIRSISDETLVKGDFKSFDFNLEKVCETAAKLCEELINKY